MNNKVKIGIIICLLLLLGIAGFTWYQNQKPVPFTNNFVTQKDNHLTAEEKKIYEDRLTLANQKLATAETDDEKYNLYMTQGQSQYGLGKLADAKAAFENAIKIKPDESTGYNALFQVQQDMTDNFGARESIKKAVSLSPNNADMWRKYILLETEKFNASNDALDLLYHEALSKTSNSIDIITVYAKFLEKMGNLPGAIDYWKKAIAANPAGKKMYQAEIDRIQKSVE